MVQRQVRFVLVAAVVLALGMVSFQGCLPPPQSTGNGNGNGGTGTPTGDPPMDSDQVHYYDDLNAHPGCSTEGLTYQPAQIPGFQCAAKEYVGQENAATPIVLLIHGNSDGPGVWEPYSDTDERCTEHRPGEGQPMLAQRLIDSGYRAYALDMRAAQICQVDRCDCQEIEVCNYTLSMDHGWGVPLAMHLITSVLEAFPGRQIALIGHSFGVTVIRDALRRLYINEDYPVWERVDDVILLSGGNHGVSRGCGYNCCGTCDHMRGTCACEMGDRDAYVPTYFSERLNGAGGAWETPCGDGNTAYDRGQACGGHAVSYTTVVMEDLPNGAQKDLCVSEQSAALVGADNRVISVEAEDQSNYFYCGLLVNHFGSARSVQAIDMILEILGN